LLVHASSKSHDRSARRVLHIEYATGVELAPDIELAVAQHAIEDLDRGSMRSHMLVIVVVSLWSAVMAGNQAAPTAALSAALRAHVKDDRFQTVTSIRGLPLGVRDGLQTLFRSQTLDIAEPGAEFQATDVVVNPKLPGRRLVAAGCSAEYCLVYYERGGFAHTWHVALFHWTPAETRFEWGGTAPAGLTKIDDVRNAVLSGAIKAPATFW
jgi:hypothetical protein